MKSKTILVIDDDMSVLETVDFILTAEGYNVLLAPNGEDGLAIIKTEWVDGIILDLRMPKLSGYLFANMVKQESINKDIKVMLLTGESLMAGNCKINLPNVSHKLSKPFDIDDLKSTLLTLINE
jgi:CheY-like chemotaxis protein